MIRALILLGASWNLCAFAQDLPTEGEGAQVRTPTPEEIRRALDRYSHEASIDSLLAALEGIPELSEETIDGLVRRGRLAALLPRLRARARRGQAVDLSERVDDLRYSTDDTLSLELALTWRLDRLVYGPNEVALARDRARRQEARVQRARLVVVAYFERRRLQLEIELMGATGVAHALRIEELAAILDALTEGAFTRLARRQGGVR